MTKDMDGTPLNVGDFVGFKDDIENSGKITKIVNGSLLTLRVWDSLAGAHYFVDVAARNVSLEARGEPDPVIAPTPNARDASVAEMVSQAVAEGHVTKGDLATLLKSEKSACAALRAYAATVGDKATYMAAAEANGINKATANTQWGKRAK